MKVPRKPPDHWQTFERIQKADRLSEILEARHTQTLHNKYLHWDKLRHLSPPVGLTHEEWWLAIKLNRSHQLKDLPLSDAGGRPFRYALADPIPERLHHVDQGSAGAIAMPESLAKITNSEMKDRYLVRSLIEESITSSQLEGAATTREVAKEMIRTKRPPRDRSEQMIVNNYATMEQIRKLQLSPLTKDLVLNIHRLVTTNTLDDPTAAGRFRRADEPIDIGDDFGQTFHVPPPADQLESRMAAMCDFANLKTSEVFLHPVLRSIVLHFWLAYDHPFKDGNGRTARALFYWSMLHRGYWLCEYISISEIILKGPSKYARAFLYTESDENDMTHFIVYHLDILCRAIEQLHAFVEDKTKQLQALERRIRGIVVLNHRQRDLISHALHHPDTRYSIESHRAGHNVAYQTARTDLLDLAERGLLSKGKVGKEWYFRPFADLEHRLEQLDSLGAK